MSDEHITDIYHYDNKPENAIRWCGRTLNFFRGCSHASEGCLRCYAEKEGGHQIIMKAESPYRNLVTLRSGRSVWNGRVEMTNVENWIATFRTRRRLLIFANSMSDIFHSAIPDSQRLLLFQTIHLARWHVFQLLTKRAALMADFISRLGLRDGMLYLASSPLPQSLQVEIENLWLGVSVENQKRADERIPELLKVKATVRFLSVEPLIAPLDLHAYLDSGIDWVIVGGESADTPRHMDLAWAEAIRKQCLSAVPRTAFFFKQHSGLDSARLSKDLNGQRYEELPHRPLLSTPSEQERRAMILWAQERQVEARKQLPL